MSANTPSKTRTEVEDLETTITCAYPYMPADYFSQNFMRLSYASDIARGNIPNLNPTSLDHIKGMHVLDLGCGSKESLELSGWFEIEHSWHTVDSQWEPWYARIASAARAQIMGIDIHSNDGEPFEGRRLDLSLPHALASFDDASFDLVHNFGFIAPPTSQYYPHILSPALIARLGCTSDPATLHPIHDLNDQITQQVLRILREGGVYHVAELILVKRQGAFASYEKNYR